MWSRDREIPELAGWLISLMENQVLAHREMLSPDKAERKTLGVLMEPYMARQGNTPLHIHVYAAYIHTLSYHI